MRCSLARFLVWIPIAFGAPLVAQTEGFEGSPEGRFDVLVTQDTRWSVVAGEAGINAEHAEHGDRCLWLKGGAQTVAEVSFERETPHAIEFLIERWTARGPFVFRIEVQDASQDWRLLADYSNRIKVGGFRTRVSEELPEGSSKLRFVVQSPEGTGVLIDELLCRVKAPMELLGFGVMPVQVPILIGSSRNPVARFEFETRGNQNPLVVTEIEFQFLGEKRAVGGFSFLVGPREAPLDFSALQNAVAADFGESVLHGPNGEVRVTGRFELPEGEGSLWLCVRPKRSANLDSYLDFRVLQIRLNGKDLLMRKPINPPGVQRFGVALRRAGDDAVPVYRIPGLVTTKQGTLIAVYDIRREGWRDLPGDIDVGMSRSTDGGRTWEPMRVILDMGEDPAFAYDGVGDPAILVDRETGTIWVAATWHHGPLGWNGSQPGFDPEQTGQLLLTRSDDDGQTWSAPINITRQVKQEEWAFLLQGPGRGITMHDGTLVFPAQYQLSPEQGREPRATILYSRDHGQSWRLGSEARSDTTEAAVVELEDGELMLNMRDNRGRQAPGARAVAVTSDLGATWGLHPTSGKALPEPVCMASLLHIGRELDGQADGRLLFSNPAVGAPPRRAMTIKASPDFGQTWPERFQVLLDEASSAGYSCLTMIDEETVGIVYEGSGAHLVFQRIPLSAWGF